MKTRLILLAIIFFIVSCNQNNNKSQEVAFKKLHDQAMKIAENYVKDLFPDAKETVSDEGILFLTKDTRCYIDPSYVIMGDITEDTEKDAIATIFIVRPDEKLIIKKHLILINKKGNLQISKIYEGDIKFISIVNGVIYIETSKIASDSPLYGCKSCTEIHQYHFIAGDTVRIK